MTHFPLGTCDTAQTCPGCALELDTSSRGPSLSSRGSVLARGSSCSCHPEPRRPCLQQLQSRGIPQPGRGGVGLVMGVSTFSTSILWASCFFPDTGTGSQHSIESLFNCCQWRWRLPLGCRGAKRQDETTLLCESFRAGAGSFLPSLQHHNPLSCTPSAWEERGGGAHGDLLLWLLQPQLCPCSALRWDFPRCLLWYCITST